MAMEEGIHQTRYVDLVTATDCCGELPQAVEHHASDCERYRKDRVAVQPSAEDLGNLRKAITEAAELCARVSDADARVALEYLSSLVIAAVGGVISMKTLHSAEDSYVPLSVWNSHQLSIGSVAGEKGEV